MARLSHPLTLILFVPYILVLVENICKQIQNYSVFKNDNVTLVCISVVGDLFKGFDFRLLSGDGIGEMRINLLKLLLNGLYLRMEQIGIIHQDPFVNIFCVEMSAKDNDRKNQRPNKFRHNYNVAQNLSKRLLSCGI